MKWNCLTDDNEMVKVRICLNACIEGIIKRGYKLGTEGIKKHHFFFRREDSEKIDLGAEIMNSFSSIINA